MAFMDNETGEIVMRRECLSDNHHLDMETGECVGNESEPEEELKQTNVRKTKFTVPKSYLLQAEPTTSKEKCCLDGQETFTLTSKKRVMELKEKIILGYNKTSHRLFLIPSLFMFPGVAAIILMITEITLHVWSHSKNSRNVNPKIYYRSPLHALTSQFCSICLETKDLHNDRYHRKRVVSSSLQ